MSRQRVRRALLFMPGDDFRKIEKGAAMDVDGVIMDLEDGVALSSKETARKTVVSALQGLEFGRAERIVRINPPSLPDLCRLDFEMTVPARPDAYILPKIESGEHVKQVDSWLTEAEKVNGWPVGTIVVIAIIETAMGVVRLAEIAGSSPRLAALAFGAEDLAGDMGAQRTSEGWEGFYARSAVVLHAKAFGLQALDTPFIDVKADEALLHSEAERAMQLGYTGKLAIHPRQVSIIQQVFTPTAAQIDHARQLIDRHDAHQARGTGVFTYEGKMVDMPMIRAAHSILERARAAGIRV
ncbi:MAG: CoA ester lyase [Anaerolineae bacterium]|nr:CoA ester lyase [Chloroflexota bacterium]MBP6297930.1 CoA ester lyase [Anaerolineae bacterium]